ncbi:MAG: thermonuclease family protein [Thermoguttaceae bacterium]
MVHRRKTKKAFKTIPNAIGFILVLLLGFLFAKCTYIPVDPAGLEETRNETVLSEQIRKVLRCVDGDTIILDENERVRFIGVDTPETKKPNTPVQPFGPEASEFTKKAIEQNQNTVRLVYDGDLKDKYGRTLAHVYLGNTLLNEELLRSGLAKAQLQYRFSSEMKERYRRAEEEAKQAKRGIWREPDNETINEMSR